MPYHWKVGGRQSKRGAEIGTRGISSSEGERGESERGEDSVGGYL